MLKRQRGATKNRMLETAAEVLRERGAAGVTIDEVLSRSAAPRGSVYHHFPGGRHQLIAEALRYAGASITTKIDESANYAPGELLGEFVDVWEQLLRDSDFTAGCPVAAAAMSTPDDLPELSAEAAQIFTHWLDALTRALVADGLPAEEAAVLGTTILAAIEGAVVLCRSLRSTQPLHDVCEQIEFLVSARKFVAKHG